MSRVMIEFGGAGPEPGARESAMRQMHDRLIAECPIRLGPVEWRFYEPSAAASMLEEAGLADHPHASGLLEFLAGIPGSQLIVTTVEVPD